MFVRLKLYCMPSLRWNKKHFCMIFTSVCLGLSPGNKKRRGTVSGFPHCPTALTTWTPCRAPPPSTAADWAVTRRGPSHCGEQQEPVQCPKLLPPSLTQTLNDLLYGELYIEIWDTYEPSSLFLPKTECNETHS